MQLSSLLPSGPLAGLLDHLQDLRPRHGAGVLQILVHQLPQDLVAQLLLAELGRAAVDVVDKHGLLTRRHACIDALAIFRWVFDGQISGVGIGNLVPRGKGLHVKYLLEVGQNRHQIVPVGVPGRVGRPEVEDAGCRIDVRIVHLGGEGDDRPGIDVVVLLRQSQLELEDAVGVRSPSDEDDAVKMPEVGEGGE